MIRALWVALVAGLAVIATGAQLDRQVANDRYYAAQLPAVFRNSSQPLIAGLALAKAAPRQALAEAKQLVRQRPMPAEHLLALGAAEQLAGDEPKFIDAIQAAARRGWRVAPLQQAQLQIALFAGAPGEAANRLAALWATGGASAETSEFTREVLATAAGRQAFARQIGATKNWQNEFLSSPPARLDAGLFAETIGMAVRRGAHFDCLLLSQAARRIALGSRLAAAKAMWSGPCARAALAAPGNAPAGPLDWQFPDTAGVTRDVRWLGKAWEMDYVALEPALSLLATRILQLTPGSHSATLAPAAGEGAVALEIACLDKAARQPSLASLSATGAVAFTVPAQDCAAQELRLQAGQGSREGLRLSVK